MLTLVIPFTQRVAANAKEILDSFMNNHGPQDVYDSGAHLVTFATPATKSRASLFHNTMGACFQKHALVDIHPVNKGTFSVDNAMFIKALSYFIKEYGVNNRPILWFGEKGNQLFKKDSILKMGTGHLLKNRKTSGGDLLKLPDETTVLSNGLTRTIEGGETIKGSFIFDSHILPVVGGMLSHLGQCQENRSFRVFCKRELTLDYTKLSGYDECFEENIRYTSPNIQEERSNNSVKFATTVKHLSDLDYVKTLKDDSLLENNSPPIQDIPKEEEELNNPHEEFSVKETKIKRRGRKQKLNNSISEE